MAVRPVPSIPFVTSSALEFAENPDGPLNSEYIHVILIDGSLKDWIFMGKKKYPLGLEEDGDRIDTKVGYLWGLNGIRRTKKAA
ncbi:hypothetical protein Hanom_Chr02g00150291 [Helianthus anomalus]